MNWDRFFKRYVWDDVKTPFLVRPSRLTRVQANYELLAYAAFLGLLFGALAVLTLPMRTAGGGAPSLFSLYAFTMTCAAVLLHYAKLLPVAQYCATAPLGFLAYIYLLRTGVEMHTPEHVVVTVGAVLWGLYSLRLVMIVRLYPEMIVPASTVAVQDHDRRR